MMRKIPIKVIFFFLILTITSPIHSSIVKIGAYTLEIIENSGRFRFYFNNEKEKDISVFSGRDPRTSSFSVFENNGFYTLGDTFHFRKKFEETADGGIFTWSSKDLIIKQVYSLNYEGFLKIDLSVRNISTNPKSIGLKFLLDTVFEREDHFYLKFNNESMEIKSEYEIEIPDDLKFVVSGARNSTGAALMMIPTKTTPSRIVLGNWDFLNNADYYYRSVKGRAFNNPPYSINDSGVLYLFSPRDILPQNSINYSFSFKAIKSVANLNDIVLEESEIQTIIENSEVPEKPIEVVPEIVVSEEKLLTDKEKTLIEVVPEPEPEIVKPLDVIENNPEIKTEAESIDENISDNSAREEVKPEEDISIINETPLETVSQAILITEDQLVEKLQTVEDINNIIETLMKKGIIEETDLGILEELINTLEELSIDENKK